jgi:hypothetical protein
MKNSKLKIGLFSALLVGLTFVSIPKAEAVQCQLVRITPDRMYAIYNCNGTEITVMRTEVIQ